MGFISHWIRENGRMDLDVLREVKSVNTLYLSRVHVDRITLFVFFMLPMGIDHISSLVSGPYMDNWGLCELLYRLSRGMVHIHVVLNTIRLRWLFTHLNGYICDGCHRNIAEEVFIEGSH
jgi:hypothetical protein